MDSRGIATSPSAAADEAGPRDAAADGRAAKSEIPIRLTLGGATLCLGVNGDWELGTDPDLARRLVVARNDMVALIVLVAIDYADQSTLRCRILSSVLANWASATSSWRRRTSSSEPSASA